jgi:hypothetical protein
MDTLVKRLHVLFEEVLTDTEMVILYYKKRNVPGMGAGVFWRDLENFRIITMNPTGWEMIKNRGMVYQFDPSPQFFLSGKAAPPKETVDSQEELSLE